MKETDSLHSLSTTFVLLETISGWSEAALGSSAPTEGARQQAVEQKMSACVEAYCGTPCPPSWPCGKSLPFLCITRRARTRQDFSCFTIKPVFQNKTPGVALRLFTPNADSLSRQILGSPVDPQLTRCRWTLSRDGHVIILISDVKFTWGRADSWTAGQGGQNCGFMERGKRRDGARLRHRHPADWVEKHKKGQ